MSGDTNVRWQQYEKTALQIDAAARLWIFANGC
jgi:hypothetical protein